MAYPQPLRALIQAFRKLPGVGSRTAERYAFQLVEWPAQRQHELHQAILNAIEKLHSCPRCGCLRDEQLCSFCDEAQRSTRTLCIVASARDAFAIDETGTYRGLYHVLGGLLSPMENVGIEQLQIASLVERIRTVGCEEVILALDATLEGDTTALYIKDELASLQVQVSRVAFGLPLGSAFAYVDGGTLARAFIGRGAF